MMLVAFCCAEMLLEEPLAAVAPEIAALAVVARAELSELAVSSVFALLC